MANTDRLDALERENAKLRSQLAVLGHQLEKHLAQTEPVSPEPAPKPPQRENRPVSIVSLTPVASADAMPSDEQFFQLQQIVLAKFPALEQAGLAPDEYHLQFRRAFRWLMVTGRLERDRVDTSRFLVDWIDKAEATIAMPTLACGRSLQHASQSAIV